MKIDHVCFYVKDAIATRKWFVEKLGFRSVGSSVNRDRATEIVKAGAIYFVLCAAVDDRSAIAHYLQQHPPGASDVAFCVDDLEGTIANAVAQGATLLQPIQTEPQPQGSLKWASIATWGDLTHTFLERTGITSLLPQSLSPQTTLAEQQVGGSQPLLGEAKGQAEPQTDEWFVGIDHVVLNVAAGDLERSVAWYEKVLGFQPQQGFAIQTNYSALCSRVMRHPLHGIQLPINEPASPNSQIQEFLDVNRGAGIQHIALETKDLIGAIAQLRRNGLPLLQVPATYYAQLRQRSGLPLSEARVQEIEQQQILVDWQNDANQAALLQTFTQPIFAEPTFFFELIQRQVNTDQQSRRAQGFGEGNFRALFEAIEREQMKRGSLQHERLA